ncbi:MAG: Maf family protein [Mariprofundaceae bacterium]|nr:Maf family protein [Mariprofundaceae bacterium]
MSDARRIILASTSPYRQILLERLHIPFQVCKPDFKEAEPGDMPPDELVRYNTLGKAASVVDKFPDATVIASDQIAVCSDTILGKPGGHDAACLQLQRLSGKPVDFLTGIALVGDAEEHYETVPFRVHFRQLNVDDIEAYLRTEQPYDCAGSFKSEGLGICLFERMEGDDPTALIGLPLITLSGWLQPLNAGH